MPLARLAFLDKDAVLGYFDFRRWIQRKERTKIGREPSAMARVRQPRRKYLEQRRRREEPKPRIAHLWVKYALAYVMVMAIPFTVFSVMANRYLANEITASIQSEMTNTLAAARQSFDQKINQMVSISLQINQVNDFRGASLSTYSYASRRTVQQMLKAFWATSQAYKGISYYQRDLPEVVFTIAGTFDVSNYRLFLDEPTGRWLTLAEMNDEQLNQVWYAADENRDGIYSKSDTLIFAQPVADIPGGFLLFEWSEAGVRSMLPAVPEGGQMTITRDGKWLYPFQPEETLVQPEPGLRQTDDGKWENSVYSPEFGLTYGYRCETGNLGAKTRTTLQIYMLVTVLIGLVCLFAIVETSRRHARPIEQLVALTEDLVPDDVYGIARLQSAMHQLRSYSQQLVDIRLSTLRTNALIRLVRGRYHSEEDVEENLRRLDMTFRQPWRVMMILQRDQAWEMDVPEKVCARLSRNHDIYGFSYAERSVFVMLVGLDSQERGPLVRELELLAQEPEFAESKPRFALGIPFEKLTQAPQSYMDALSAGRRMTGEGVAVYEQSEPEETPFYPEEELQALETALNHQDRNRTAFLYDILMTMVSRNRHVYLYTVTLLSEMIRLYTQALPEENGGESGCGPVVCGQCVNDVEDMLDCLRSLHTQALQHMAEQDLENSATEMTGIANYISSCEELDTLTVSTVAERYGMNASSLSHRFKKQMGCNISDYIFTCKMNHACALLRSTDQTVAEIAQQVGYSQYTSFVRQFKRQKGLTPTAYRDAWRKEHE